MFLVKLNKNNLITILLNVIQIKILTISKKSFCIYQNNKITDTNKNIYLMDKCEIIFDNLKLVAENI